MNNKTIDEATGDDLLLDKTGILLAGSDDSLFERLRNKSVRFTPEEKDVLREFSRMVNKHICAGSANAQELCYALEIVHRFMLEPEWVPFATECMNLLTASIPY